MEMIPSIANYFGISIDTLFGLEADRERKIEKIDYSQVEKEIKADSRWAE